MNTIQSDVSIPQSVYFNSRRFRLKYKIYQKKNDAKIQFRPIILYAYTRRSQCTLWSLSFDSIQPENRLLLTWSFNFEKQIYNFFLFSSHLNQTANFQTFCTEHLSEHNFFERNLCIPNFKWTFFIKKNSMNIFDSKMFEILIFIWIKWL